MGVKSNDELPLCGMKVYEKVEVQLHSFLNFALDGGEQLHSFTAVKIVPNAK
jgi:hypothetical protein